MRPKRGPDTLRVALSVAEAIVGRPFPGPVEPGNRSCAYSDLRTVISREVLGAGVLPTLFDLGHELSHHDHRGDYRFIGWPIIWDCVQRRAGRDGARLRDKVLEMLRGEIVGVVPDMDSIGDDDPYRGRVSQWRDSVLVRVERKYGGATEVLGREEVYERLEEGLRTRGMVRETLHEAASMIANDLLGGGILQIVVAVRGVCRW